MAGRDKLRSSRETGKHDPVGQALRATGALGLRQGVAILVAIVGAKAWAVLVGSEGVGLGSLMNSLVALAGIVGGLGVATALVRLGSGARGADDPQALDRYRAAALRTVVVAGGVVVLVLVLARDALARILLDDAGLGWAVWFIAPAVLLNLVAGVQESRLTIHRRVDVLARAGIVASVVGVSIGIAAVATMGLRGIAPAVLASALVAVLSVTWFTRRALGAPPSPAAGSLAGETRGLLAWGLPYTASQLAGAGVATLLPFVVMHLLGTESVGYHRAAVALSTTYLAVLLEAMSRDYFPRISQVGDDPAALREAVDGQVRIMLYLGVPPALAVLTLAPDLIPLLYTAEFLPAVEILRWQLVGDVFKVASWALSIAVMTRLGSRPYFLLELAGGAALLGCTWTATWWFGLSGIGIGFLVAYVLYFLLVLAIAARRLGVMLSARSFATVGTAAALLLFLTLLPELGLAAWRLPLGLSLSGAAAVASGRWALRTLRR